MHRLHGYLFATARAMVRRMSEHIGLAVEGTEFGPFHPAAIAEITNQVSGRATMRLAQVESEYFALVIRIKAAPKR